MARSAMSSSSAASVRVRVALVGTDLSLRRALRRALAADGLVPVEERSGTRADVLVWIGGLASWADLEALRNVLEPDRRVLAVAPAVEPSILRAALHDGLRGCVLEIHARRVLAPAVRSVACGQAVVPPELFAPPAPSLSAREKQVLGMVVLGFANAEIAGKLCLAESTVKSHLTSVFVKLGVRNRREAVAAVLDPDSRAGLGVLGITGAPSE